MPFLFDKEIVTEIFRSILWSLDQIRKRFAIIKTSEDFIKDDEGLENSTVFACSLSTSVRH
jgi:hypothetical protein